MKKYIVFISLSLLFLVYFVSTSSWHKPSDLVLQGRGMSGSEVTISWDSGIGYNGLEAKTFLVRDISLQKQEPRKVQIKRRGSKNTLSRGSEVWLQRVEVNNKVVTLESLANANEDAELKNGNLYLAGDGQSIEVESFASDYIKLLLIIHPYSGEVEITAGDDVQIHDLYSETQQVRQIIISPRSTRIVDFEFKAALPAYGIDGIRIMSGGSNQFEVTSVRICSESGDVSLSADEAQSRGMFEIEHIKRNTKTYFSVFNFALQLLFALMTTGSIFVGYNKFKYVGGLNEVFCGGKRRYFWITFLCSTVVYLSWLYVYWPGTMSTDSIVIWRSAHFPQLHMSRHPVLNVLFYKYIIQFWDSIAAVALVQVLMTASLGSYIFYYLYKRGLSLGIILPFHVLLTLSIPVGLYNIILWKDIPFALAVVACSFYLVKLKIEKDDTGRFADLTDVVLLSILLMLIIGLRYNGLSYVVVVPGCLAIWRLLAPKRLLLLLCIPSVLVLVLMGMMFFEGALDARFTKSDKTALEFVKWKLDGVDRKMKQDGSLMGSAIRVITGYFKVFDINDHYSNYWEVCSNKDFAAIVRRFDLHEHNKPMKLKTREQVANSLHEKLRAASMKGMLYYVSWNPFYMVYIFLIVLILARWCPLSAIYSAMILSQVLLLIFVTNLNWRYYYFFYFSGYFLIPIISLDVKNILTKSGRQGHGGGQ